MCPAWAGLGLGGSCASQAVSSSDFTPSPAPGGMAVAGRVVDADCNPLENIKVLACTNATCLTGDTLPDGTYSIALQATAIEPRKMRAIGVSWGRYDALYFQDLEAGQTVFSSMPIVLPVLPSTPTVWTEEEGGTVLLADDVLELTAAPGTVDYPLGVFDEEVSAVQVAAGDLPPFDVAPWVGKESFTLAFMLSPYELSVTEPLSMRVVGMHGCTGDTYAIWSGNSHTGRLEQVGSATVDGSGNVVSDPDAELLQLTTIVLVPDGGGSD